MDLDKIQLSVIGLAGILGFLAAVLKPDWFLKLHINEPFVKLLGFETARILLAVLGVAMLWISIWVWLAKYD
ncbi:MAG: hypothetical protein RJA81_548 [Planctomycetota bacterium]|jgi:hypothetical protein